MKREAVILGLIAVASLGLVGCSSTKQTSSSEGQSISGTIVTTQTVRLTSDPGTEPQPLPNPILSDSGWMQICQGERSRMAGTTRWYYAPDGDAVSLDGHQVTIKDAKNGIVGLPKLKLGGVDTHILGQAKCEWTFTLSDFASSSKFFTVEVGGVPGTQNVSRADLLAGVKLTAG